MSDDPVSLDARRSTEGQMATDFRRHALREFEADQEALRKRQEELEAQLIAEPSVTWMEAAVKAQYLIRRYAETAEARDARKQELIQRALGDLARLIWGRAARVMSEPLPDDTFLQRAMAVAPKERACLRCQTAFWSEGFGERICKRCKGSHSWRNAVPVSRGSTGKS